MKRPQIAISEENILKVLQNKQRQNSVATPVDDRSARMGDQAVIDFEGTQDGITIPGSKSCDYPLILGSHSMIPGFEEQIVGKKPGESFDVNVTFPENYHIRRLGGKPAMFHATLKKLQLLEYQPIDDDFARDFSEYDTLSDWKDAIQEDLLARRETSVYERLSREILSEVIDNSEIPIDDEMRDLIADELYDDFLCTLEENRMTLESYCKRSGCTEEEIRDAKRRDAVRSIQEQSVLHAIAAAEHLRVSENELEQEIDILADDAGETPEEFRASLDDMELESITDGICMNKALNLVIHSAVFVDE